MKTVLHRQKAVKSLRQNAVKNLRQNAVKSLRQNAVKSLRQNTVKSLRQNAVKNLRQNAVKSLRQNAVKSLRQNADYRKRNCLPSSTKVNPKDQVKSISTTIKADSYPMRRIGSSQYAVSTGQSRTLMYETRETTILFPRHLNGYYYEENKGSYGPQFLKAYFEASRSIPQKKKDLGSFTLPCFINNVCFDNALVDLGARVSVMPLSTYLKLGLGELAHTKLTIELADRTVKYPKGIAENVLVGISKFTFPIDFIILDMPEDIKVSLILRRPFLSTTRAKIDVYKRKITLRVGEERIVFTSVKPTSSLVKRVYMLSLREIMELDLEARLMGETLVLNRSLNPFLEDYIELNDLNEPFELKKNQGDDFMPTIKEGEVSEEFRTRDDELNSGIDDYPSYCDYDKKIHIDCAHNLKFSCKIGFEFTHTNFFPLLYVNVMSKKFHNSIIKEKMVYKGNNVVGALMNIPIFVGTFYVMTDFAVLEDMDAYRDEEMGDVIFGEPFLREVGIKTRRFEGMITIYNGHYRNDCPKLKDQNHENKIRNKNGIGEARGKEYVMGGGDANPNSNVVKGTFLLNNHYASMLFDSGADQSFISTTFSTLLDVTPDTYDVSYAIELADRRISKTNTILRGCTLGLLGHPFNIDLMPVELGSYDVIIDMDWLANHHAVIICDEKIVRIPYGDKVLIVQGDRGGKGEKSKLSIISCTKSQKYIKRGCLIFLAQVMMKETEDKSEEKRLKDVPCNIPLH
ncbi:putative reverse transcriptase domain-containing protein [Tanacetum coccineum]